ncbi:MAG: hypothetical protein ACOX3T_06970 [Bdellovibrionota bacterium]
MNNLEEKKKQWQECASKKSAIVPMYFEVFPYKVDIVCGNCEHFFSRTLIPNLDEPTFVCPNCNIKNWVPVRYDLR